MAFRPSGLGRVLRYWGDGYVEDWGRWGASVVWAARLLPRSFSECAGWRRVAIRSRFRPRSSFCRSLPSRRSPCTGAGTAGVRSSMLTWRRPVGFSPSSAPGRFSIIGLPAMISWLLPSGTELWSSVMVLPYLGALVASGRMGLLCPAGRRDCDQGCRHPVPAVDAPPDGVIALIPAWVEGPCRHPR